MVDKNQILNIMRHWAPEDQAESWDNVGLQLDSNRDIQKVAIVLELNLDTFSILNQQNYDFIISHHPLIFKPISNLGYDDWAHEVLRYLIRNDIGLYVSHTNLDRALDGVSYELAKQYQLRPKAVRDLKDGYGKVFEFSKPLDLDQLEEHVPAVAKIIPDDLEINSVAFMGGSGKSFINDIVHQSIDFYITGELGYHDIQYLRQQKKGLFLLGHYQSEVFVLDAIKSRLDSLALDIEIIS
ncbi:MAG: Nif3-like dinuclear metal center hexameric protein [Candidatus Margulisiibacteriota bacterium]